MSRYVHTSPQTLYWAEKASYRRALLSRTLDSEKCVTRLCLECTTFDSDILFSAAKAHHEYVSQNHLPLKYATVLRSHLYLIEDHTADTSLRDIVKVEEQYELLLRRVTSFPRAGDVNTRMLDFVDRVFKIWLSANSEAALKQHARHEVDEPDTLRVIGIMERALSYTFQSHRLLRYLLTLHMALNNKSQALKAFELYEKLWEKAKETDLVNVSRKLRQFRLEDEANDSADVPKQAPSANGHLATAAAPVQPDDEEADIDRPLTYIGACCLAAKVYCSDPRREDEARKATSFMERALELIPEGTSNEIRASVQKWLGIAKACQAFDGPFYPAGNLVWECATDIASSSEYNPETRPVLLKSALALLTSSVTDNPASFEAHYHLALLQAEQGQNTSAIATIQKGLQINPGSSEAWNLLVLLISAETSRKAEALQLATAALSGHLSQDEPDVPDSAFTTNTYSLPRANLSDAVTFTSLRAIIQLRITRIVLIEATEGPQAALVFFKELYSSFAKDFAPFLQSAPSASSEAAPLGHAAPPNGAPPNQHSHLQVAASSLLPTRRLSLRSKRARKVRPHSTAADTSRPGSVAASASPGSSRPASVADGDLGSGAAPESATMSSQSNNWTGSTTQLGQCRHRQAQAMEQMLWLLTAATFRRAGDLEQAREAIFEAEKIDPTRPDVWVQLGLLQAQQEDIDAAIESMDKALTFSLDYVPALVHLSRLLILKRAENSSLLDLAAGYMKECSEQRGHSTADVWLTLGQIYELQERWAESRAALLKALELQERQPIRPLEIALPRIL